MHDFSFVFVQIDGQNVNNTKQMKQNKEKIWKGKLTKSRILSLNRLEVFFSYKMHFTLDQNYFLFLSSANFHAYVSSI